MLDKAYNPQGTEDRIYKLWEESGAFMASAQSDKDPFTIAMPPPNATGNLHLGHAVMLAIEDIFIRFARMQGKEALWIPGTDHAAIATESVVIKKIQKEEKIPDPRAHLGREELLRRIADFVEQSRCTIRSQVRKMGSSCDWSRERYTMEPALNRCVNEVFVKMYRDGLIYRGHRIVNWDPKLQTTVSDDEIEWKEETAPLYTFQYGPFQISTARPETKFGDKYVVMHPDDVRYAKFKHGDTFESEWINGTVMATVIKDKAVDPEFGTGVMTITPWHDAADFEIAERHDLKKEQIIGYDGKLLPIAGEFAGLKIEDARPQVVEKLKEKGLLVKIDENYVHNIATSYRGGGAIEPQIKEQWFIDVNKRVVMWKRRELSLKEIMQEVVKTGEIKIIPERFEKVYFHWIDNLRDWCISRQIWWGHRVPVYYCNECSFVIDDQKSGQCPPAGRAGTVDSEQKDLLQTTNYKLQTSGLTTFVSPVPLSKCPACHRPLEQDPDTLDTWFSSALWTWSALVDPKVALDPSVSFEDMLKHSPDFQKFHSTQVMETGYDILFFWVARMILMTTYAVGDIPFETVYLHGLIRTRDGKKMSKSHPETMIDPLDMIAKYGADALRLSMIVGQSAGADSRLYEEKIVGYRNFVNKLWNASRFVLLQCEAAGLSPAELKIENEKLKVENLSLADRALLSELQRLIENVTIGIHEYRLSDVGEQLYSFVWDFFCDWYLELSKGNANLAVLVHTLRKILQLLHPYAPFVTEELWSHVKPVDAGMLIQKEWPEAKESLIDKESEAEFLSLISVIQAIRKLRVDNGVEPGKKLAVTIVTKDFQELLESQQEHIKRLAKLESLTITVAKPESKNVVSAFLEGIEVYLSLDGLVDLEKEKKNLEVEKKKLSEYLQTIDAKLNDATFTSKAPEKVIIMEKEKKASMEAKMKKIVERLQSLI